MTAVATTRDTTKSCTIYPPTADAFCGPMKENVMDRITVPEAGALTRRRMLGLFGAGLTATALGASWPNAQASAAELVASRVPGVDVSRLRALQARGVVLQNSIVNFWKQYGLDPLGGFYGELDKTGTPTSATNKFVHVEARHLWSFSMWHRLKEPTDAIKATCDNLLAFLDHFYDQSDGRFFYSVSRDGATVLDPKKMMYAQSFVILALTEYATAFDSAAVADKALALFRAVDKDHDAVNGGYDQTTDAWFWSSAASTKAMNVHMHLMESLTSLYALTGDATVRARVEELTHLFETKIVQPQNYYHTEFTATWAPAAAQPTVEFGHDLQIYWQLTNALKVLGGARRSTTSRLARIADVAAAAGIDGANGYATYGVPGGPLVAGSKVWWVQAEAINGLLRLYLNTKHDVQLDRIESTLSFVERAFLDPDAGELYTEVSATGTPLDTRKGYEWKASYHALRFAVNLDVWTADALA